jgi:[acyl-carrier-protein] S-malonyltransferase
LKALLFPGQGSQYVGMGLKWMDRYPYIKDIYQRADQALGFSISNLCFEGPEHELVRTEFTQPAILTSSIAMYEILKREKNISCDFVAGHSLGEYSALVAAGALTLEDAVRTVNLRGRLMQKAVPAGKGKMAAVIRCDENILNEEIKIVLSSLQSGAVLAAANYNSDDQTVVSGSAEAVDLLVKNLKEKKIKAIPLSVSAPFHSSMMEEIVSEFKAALQKITISQLNTNYVANVDAKVYKDSLHILNNLILQIPGSVKWKQTINTLSQAGVTRAIEVGPGKVLSGLNARIEGSFECISMDSLEDISTLQEGE